jgi:hypothetical protein
MFSGFSIVVSPIEIPVRRPQVMPGALDANNGTK